jgi:hypothetical protein
VLCNGAVISIVGKARNSSANDTLFGNFMSARMYAATTSFIDTGFENDIACLFGIELAQPLTLINWVLPYDL